MKFTHFSPSIIYLFADILLVGHCVSALWDNAMLNNYSIVCAQNNLPLNSKLNYIHTVIILLLV